MNKKRAIEKLNDIRCHVKETSTEEQALVMAINALQGTTSDLISRQAAIDALCAINDKYNENPHIDAIIDAIEALPTVQPEPQWISVSEKLPEDMQYVLLTVRRLNNAYNPRPFISVGYIGWNQHHWWCAHDGDCAISKVEVLAWMPLPEPYKPNK